mmetsp:Transcript_11877/g.17200  ORF Transcript_11877/g.17200 Transcript_11877/m.17200 type:complete len:128 (+) Transcript_11877:123-506(+)
MLYIYIRNESCSLPEDIFMNNPSKGQGKAPSLYRLPKFAGSAKEKGKKPNLEWRCLNSCLLVFVINNLHVPGSSHNDWAFAVNIIRGELEHPLNLPLEHTSRGNSSCLFNDHCHGNSLIQTTQLSLG